MTSRNLAGTAADIPSPTDVAPGTNYYATDTGALSSSNGSSWLTIPVGTSATSWLTSIDIDFTAEANQTLTTDGTYTIGGLTFTKQNSAHDHTAMALVNGTGLVVAPNNTSNYDGATRTMPLIRLPLSSLPGVTWDWRTTFRVYVDEVDGGTQANDYAIFGLDVGSAAWATLMFRGHNTGPTPAAALKFIAGSTNVTVSIANIGVLNSTTETSLIETLDMLQPFFTIYTGAAYTGGAWPNYSNLQPWSTDTSNEAGNLISNIGAPPAPGSLGIVLGGVANGTSDNPTFTYKRLRVDYKQNH